MIIGFPRKDTFVVARWVFLRLLALIYFSAFVSLGSQIIGLIGEHGILPAASYVKAAEAYYGAHAAWSFPTLCWFGTSDFFLRAFCTAGAGLSLFLLVGVASVPVLFMLWVLYLSLFTVGAEFLSFQWDILLLEVGFLSIFLAPLTVRPGRDRVSPPSAMVHGLFTWLLFRLMFLSGFVKLASGDATWRNLTALTYHYETQPIPPWTAWYMHHLPAGFHAFSAIWMFAIELAAPFFLFAPRPLRRIAAGLLIFLQLLIFGTGNYGFFNVLAVALCLLMLDDKVWPAALRRRIYPDTRADEVGTGWRFPRVITIPLAAILLILSISQSAERMGLPEPFKRALSGFRDTAEPFHLTNTYGLFAVMTTSRPEIILEGSLDGVEWKAYEFKYKPGDLNRAPAFFSPHMPRLDWQMWFAALSSFPRTRWFQHFSTRLLEGSPEVTRLLKTNPFPDTPPNYLRAAVYDYHFTDAKTRSETGAWWRRDNPRAYSPILSLSKSEVA